MNLGISGRITQATIRSPLTPLFLLTAIALGFLALITIPREEEPQISVPLVDIMVRADGLKAPDAATGACADPQTQPVYRIWNGRVTDVNHRYTTSAAVRDQMVAAGGIAEGYGPDAVAMCAPR